MDAIARKTALSDRELQILSTELQKKVRSTGTAYLLWFFTGLLGGHQFYLGRWGWGIAYLCSLGIFGIGCLIDLFTLSAQVRRANERIESDIIHQIHMTRVIPESTKKATERESSSEEVTRRGGLLNIDSIGFFGPFATSPNGKYTIAWMDGDISSGKAGSRDEGEGTYVLLDGDKVVSKGRLQRPNDGQVADNGTFVINDWMFGNDLNGTFCAFDRKGRKLVEKLFTANLERSAVSPDGKFAVCQTLASDTEDNSLLSFFDLDTGGVVWQKIPETLGGAKSYEFDVEGRTLYLAYEGLGKFAYSFSGLFLDEERWRDSQR